MKGESIFSLFKKAKKKLGITGSSFLKGFRKICESVLDNNEEEERKNFKILIKQVELITKHLKSVWKSKKGNSNFKHLNVEQLRYELSFNELFLEGKFLKALEYKANHYEIFIHLEENNIKRIYEIKTNPILFQNAFNFYDLLIFFGIKKANLNLNDIWDDYCRIKNISKESPKKSIL